jgi:hypothetical protein
MARSSRARDSSEPIYYGPFASTARSNPCKLDYEDEYNALGNYGLDSTYDVELVHNYQNEPTRAMNMAATLHWLLGLRS